MSSARFLIDDVLPRFDVRERHRTVVHSTATAAYAAISTADLAASPLVRALLAVRALPAALISRRHGIGPRRTAPLAAVTIRTFEAHGFRVIGERPPHELLIGLEGRFWRLRGDLCSIPPTGFATPEPAPGTVRAACNFTVSELGEGRVALATETRVQCADEAARRRFLPYWYLIRPASGLIRRLMLREIRRTAEGAAPFVRGPGTG
jgi:hypothetical protein